MSTTAVGSGDNERPKKFSDKIKNSPAAKQYREKGAKSVAKTLKGMAKDVAKESASKASNALGLSSPSAYEEGLNYERDRGNVTGRKSQFVSSYHSAKQLKQNLTCATCAIEGLQY